MIRAIADYNAALKLSYAQDQAYFGRGMADELDGRQRPRSRCFAQVYIYENDRLIRDFGSVPLPRAPQPGANVYQFTSL